MQTEQDGVRPSAYKLFKTTHTKKSDKSKFIDKRSETVNVSMKIFLKNGYCIMFNGHK